MGISQQTIISKHEKKKKRNLGIPYTAQNLFFLKTQPSHPHKKKRKEAAF